MTFPSPLRRTLHWTAGAYRRFLLQTRQRPYYTSSTYAFPFLPESLPLEAVLKIVVPLGAILGNLIGPEGVR